MHILDLLARKKPTISVEFFPPKSASACEKLIDQIQVLDHLNLDFISITYGAGGGKRGRTLDLVSKLCTRRPIPHLTCVGHTREEIRGIVTCLVVRWVRAGGTPVKRYGAFSPNMRRRV